MTQEQRLAQESAGYQHEEEAYNHSRLALYNKLYKVQGEIGKISKDLNNPFYKSKYFDVNKLVEHVTPHLQKEGLLLLQPVIDYCVYTRIICMESGEYVESVMPMPEISDPQKMGSVITYFRRYTLQSLLALQAEDDDGNLASQGSPAPKKKSFKKSAPQDDDKKWLNEGTKEWQNAEEKVRSGKIKASSLRDYYKVSGEAMDFFMQLEEEAGEPNDLPFS